MENKSKEVLIKLAKDIKNNLVFIDRYIPEHLSLENIFMPLLFMDEGFREELKKDPPGLIYEYLSEANPRSVNGYPTFMSLRMISIEDTKILGQIMKKLEEAENKAVNTIFDSLN